MRGGGWCRRAGFPRRRPWDDTEPACDLLGMLQGETGEGVGSRRGQRQSCVVSCSVQPDPWGSSGMLRDTLGLALTRQEGWVFRLPPSLVIGSQVLRLSKEAERIQSLRQASAEKVAGVIHQRRHTEAGWGDCRNGEGDQGLWVGHKGWSSGIVPTTDRDSLQTEVLAPR